MGWRISHRRLGLMIVAFVVVFVAGASPSAAQTPPRTFSDCADCPEMVVVPAGSFTMGSPATEAGRYPVEGPQRQITLARPFAVGRFEITRAQYAAFSSASGRAARGNCSPIGLGLTRGSWKDPGFRQDGDHPVVCVSWEDAQAYVAWLNSQTSGGYRLLTEAEWEYAARAGSTSRYPWGSRANLGCTYMNGADVTFREWEPDRTIVTCNDDALHTAAVGSYRPNAFGISDMIGNVMELTSDCYEIGIRLLDQVPADGRARTSADCGQYVIRGGSWGDGPRVLRSAFRDVVFTGPTETFASVGFRVAKTL